MIHDAPDVEHRPRPADLAPLMDAAIAAQQAGRLEQAESLYAQVLTAQSGVEAAELLDHDSRFDAILCDLMMPGMNGQQLFDHVARHHPSLVSRMIFMTGAASTVAIRDFLGRIANDRLDKPFRVRDVERALDRLMGPPVRVHA